MKNTKQNKNMLINVPMRKNRLFYLILFAAATLASVAIIIVALNGFMRMWKIYSVILCASFSLLTVIFAILCYASSSRMYATDEALFIKSGLLTRKISLSEIEDIKVKKHEDKDVSTVKIITIDKTYKYTYKGLSKEDSARIRKIL